MLPEPYGGAYGKGSDSAAPLSTFDEARVGNVTTAGLWYQWKYFISATDDISDLVLFASLVLDWYNDSLPDVATWLIIVVLIHSLLMGWLGAVLFVKGNVSEERLHNLPLGTSQTALLGPFVSLVVIMRPAMMVVKSLALLAKALIYGLSCTLARDFEPDGDDLRTLMTQQGLTWLFQSVSRRNDDQGRGWRLVRTGYDDGLELIFSLILAYNATGSAAAAFFSVATSGLVILTDLLDLCVG